MKDIYFISGLGADERMFQFIDLSGFQIHHISWVKPDPKDSIRSYAAKLIPQIKQEHEVYLIGVSLGGIIAQEISQLIEVKKVMIISSVKSVQEFDWKLRLLRRIPLHRLFKPGMLKFLNVLTANYFFSVKTKAESRLLNRVIKDTDNEFVGWAINAILNWDRTHASKDLIHIHGSRDRIFPIQPLHDFISIAGAGHFMIVNRSKEISAFIREMLK